MRAIRDRFQANISREAEHAIGVYVIAKLGKQEHARITAQYPNAPIQVGTGTGANPTRTISFSPTHGAVQTLLTTNENLVVAGFHATVVQHWHDFLTEIFSFLVSEEINGRGNFNLQSMQLQTKPSEFAGANTTNQIIQIFTRAFDFTRSDEKYKKVRKALNVTTVTNVEQATIERHIAIRNLIQHNQGVVRAQDLADLGIRSFPIDRGHRVDNVGVGSSVECTPYDLETLCNVLISVSNKLVP